VAGRLLQREIQFLSSLANNTDKRLVSILGGSKVGDKIKLI
jgi:phosphoglycerate kinase